MKQYMTISEVCERFQISRPTERKMRRSGILKPTINQGRFVRYAERDFMSDMSERSEK